LCVHEASATTPILIGTKRSNKV